MSAPERQLSPPDTGDIPESEYQIARTLAHQYLTTTAIEIPMEMLEDDFRHALGRDYPLLLEALQTQDDCEAGGLIRDALDKCADKYLDTAAGKVLVEDYMRGVEPE